MLLWPLCLSVQIVTFDMGGGTTDICVLHLEEGRFEVLVLEGDTHLGGEDMDWLLLQHGTREGAGSEQSRRARAYEWMRGSAA